MKLKFKHQAYQADAVKAVVDCFQGQPKSSGLKYAIDPGAASPNGFVVLPGTEVEGFANASFSISPAMILKNLQEIQREQKIPVSDSLKVTDVSKLNLDVEMETSRSRKMNSRLKRTGSMRILKRRSSKSSGINVAVFGQYKRNPEDFILKAGKLINEQKATVIVEHLEYDTTTGVHETPDIFTQRKADLGKGFKAEHHIYDYVFTDSTIERNFVGELDASAEVVVYAKLPKTFFIPTPVGNYNPDWAIAFKQDKVKHIYFIAETKGDMSSMQLRKIEESKIKCARKFFAKITNEQVRYEVVDGYGKLMEMVK